MRPVSERFRDGARACATRPMLDEDPHAVMPRPQDRGREIDRPDGLRCVSVSDAIPGDLVRCVEGIRIESHAIRVVRRQDGGAVTPGALALAHSRAVHGKREGKQVGAQRPDALDDSAARRFLSAD